MKLTNSFRHHLGVQVLRVGIHPELDMLVLDSEKEDVIKILSSKNLFLVAWRNDQHNSLLIR
jgi:hypothetical protein